MKSWLTGLAMVIMGMTHLVAGKYDGKTLPFASIYEAMLGNELTSMDDSVVMGRPGAFYAINGLFILSHVTFEFNRLTDDYWDKRYANGGERLTVKKTMEFFDCDFSEYYWFLFRNMVFEEAFTFHHCTRMKFLFKDCVFKGPFILANATEVEFIEFENCTFERGISFTEGTTVDQHLKFNNCTFRYNPAFIDDPKTNDDKYLIGGLTRLPSYFYFAHNVQPFDLSFRNCKLMAVEHETGKNELYADLSHSTFNSLEITGCEVGVPVDLSYAQISNQFKIYHSQLAQLAADAINFNTSNAKLDWAMFAGRKLSVKHEVDIPTTTENVKKVTGTFWNGDSVLAYKDKYEYETLISVYALFYAAYKQQGNRRSANACYVEWKDIETRFFRQELENDFTINTWFNWFMNIFLRFFCDYGTNPFKSLMLSFAVMFLFTIIFMMYLWNYDTSEHKDIRLVFKNFGKYFTDGLSLTEVGKSMVPEKKDTTSSTELRTYIKENKLVLPLYYRFFGLKLARPGFTFRSMFFYRVGDKILGKWEDAKKTRRLLVASAVSLWIGGLMLKILFIRIFDAFTMSVNSFSTLGYGDLPQNETMRYLSILEGFIGWFLLSIFSVALISQIIQ